MDDQAAVQEGARCLLMLWHQYGRWTKTDQGWLAFNHECMSAGEDASEFLAGLGLVVVHGWLAYVTRTGLELMELTDDYEAWEAH